MLLLIGELLLLSKNLSRSSEKTLLLEGL